MELWVELYKQDKNWYNCERRNTGGHLKAGRTLLFSEYAHAGSDHFDYINDYALSDNSDMLAELIGRENETKKRIALREGYAALKPHHRELLNKIYVQNKKATEVAKESGVSDAAVSQQLQLIYRKLKAHITLAIDNS